MSGSESCDTCHRDKLDIWWHSDIDSRQPLQLPYHFHSIENDEVPTTPKHSLIRTLNGQRMSFSFRWFMTEVLLIMAGQCELPVPGNGSGHDGIDQPSQGISK